MAMTIQDIYQLFIEKGKEHDPRAAEVIARELTEIKKEFEELSEDKKGYFDQDRLINPYDDTRILCGKPTQKVKTILCGIDVEVQELLLADRLIEKGEKIDLVLAHHPEGKALLGLSGVMNLQEDVLMNQGVPIALAQGLLSSRINEIKRAFLPYNVQRGIDAARLLKLPFMCVHTPADNQVQWYLEQLFVQEDPQTVQEVLDLLEAIPEYQEAMRIGAGPLLITGEKKRRCGNIMVDMTGGTSGSADAYEKLANAGVGTIVCMHMSEAYRKEAEKHHLNIIIAGHIASDSLGMNLLLDELIKQGIKIIPFSGLYRIKR